MSPKPNPWSRRAALGATLALPATRLARAQGKPAAKAGPELYELRVVHMRIGTGPKLVNDFYGGAFIEAARKLGAGPVGAFNVTFGPEAPTLYVLVPWPSFAAYEKASELLPAELAKSTAPAARAYLDAPGAQPPYVRMETHLLRAFDSFPRVEVPPKKPRILELRTYESPHEAGHARKMEMFTPKLGELEIFRRVGLTPVFFGRALAGPRLPSFTYGLVFPDLAAREAAWTTFRGDPAWQKLRSTPGYSDAEIMANITSLILTPTDYSQI